MGFYIATIPGYPEVMDQPSMLFRNSKEREQKRGAARKSFLSTTFVGVVYPNQIDHMGHVNVQYYASMFDQATWAFLSEFGITSEYMKVNHRGMAAVSQQTKYLLELFSGDVVEIQTELLDVTEKSIRFVHTMRRRPRMDTIATSELVGVHIDADMRKSCPFPQDIKERLSQHAPGLESGNQRRP